MLPSKISKSRRFFHTFIKALGEQALCFFLLALVFRTSELLFTEQSQTITLSLVAQSIGNEVAFVLLLILSFGWILALISRFSRIIYKILLCILTFLILFIYLVSTQYYYATQFLLDRVIFFFSIPELKHIASSEWSNVWSKFSMLYICSLVFFIVLCISIIFNKLRSCLNFLRSIIFLGFLIMIAFSTTLFLKSNSLDPNQGQIAISKPLYFCTNIISGIFPSKQTTDKIAAIDAFRNFAELPNHPMQYEFPLMRPLDTSKDELSKYFQPFNGPPSVVLVFMEGMGSAYSGPGAYYGSMTPNLDSIYKKSLYWPNTISNTDRTHGIFANILASTPHGFERGITNLKLKEYPQMLSLSKIACSNGYQGNFIYGGWAYFDNYEPFLKINYMQNVFEEKYLINTYGAKKFEVEGKHSWGIPDDQLFEHYFSLLSDTFQSPYLNVVMTQSLHTPFLIHDQEKYIQIADLRIQENGGKPEVFRRNKNAWATLVYVDEAIGEFMDEYKSKPNFQNTIFVFVGDHNSQAFNFKNILDMHHVPLAIYSPKLKEAQKFKDIVSHTGLTASLLRVLIPYLKETTLPQYSNWMSSGLSMENTLSAKNPIYIGSFSGDINGVIKDDILLFRDRLYKIKSGLMLEDLGNEKMKKQYQHALESYKFINKYVLEENKLLMNDGKKFYPNAKADFYFPE